MNLSWFKNYLTNRKQYIEIDHEKGTDLFNIKCGVPQGSILSRINPLDLIMFAGNMALLLSHKNMKTLFNKMNIELTKIKKVVCFK